MFGKKKSDKKNENDVSDTLDQEMLEEEFSSVDDESADELVLDEDSVAGGDVMAQSSDILSSAAADFMVSTSGGPFSLSNVEENVLLVGNGTKLKGEISNCDKLIIEGTADVTVTDVVSMNVTPNGIFDGTANVQDALIEGQLSGELTVHGILTISSSGTVSGTINYKQLRIEEGGEISGNIVKNPNPKPNKNKKQNADKPSLKAQFAD